MNDPCVIVGMEVATALGAGVDCNWTGLVEGRSAILPMSRFDGTRYAAKVAAEIPRDVLESLRDKADDDALSDTYRLALWVSRRALQEADTDAADVRTALILSTTKADFHDFEKALATKGYRNGRRFNLNVMAGDLARILSLSGPTYAVSNACASGLVAMSQGARLLARNTADRVVVVGVDTLSDFVLSGFSSLRALSETPARPFDENRDGLSLGEGAAAVVLMRQSSASSMNGVRVRAVLRGWGGSNDAEHITAPSREGTGLRQAMEAALEMADLRPEDIDLINAHGTGTRFNDDMEAAAITTVFGSTPHPPTISMKGSFGHTLGAAGIVEAVLSVCAIEHETTPPSIGFELLGVSGPMNIPRTSCPTPGLKNVLCLKSGFGGVNAALLMSGSV